MLQGASNDLFAWANSNTTKSDDNDLASDEEDPIGDLLKSNKAVFGKRNEVLHPGNLQF